MVRAPEIRGTAAHGKLVGQVVVVGHVVVIVVFVIVMVEAVVIVEFEAATAAVRVTGWATSQ